MEKQTEHGVARLTPQWGHGPNALAGWVVGDALP
jgi:hypothetical protein